MLDGWMDCPVGTKNKDCMLFQFSHAHEDVNWFVWQLVWHFDGLYNPPNASSYICVNHIAMIFFGPCLSQTKLVRVSSKAGEHLHQALQFTENGSWKLKQTLWTEIGSHTRPTSNWKSFMTRMNDSLPSGHVTSAPMKTSQFPPSPNLLALQLTWDQTFCNTPFSSVKSNPILQASKQRFCALGRNLKINLKHHASVIVERCWHDMRCFVAFSSWFVCHHLKLHNLGIRKFQINHKAMCSFWEHRNVFILGTSFTFCGSLNMMRQMTNQWAIELSPCGLQ